MDAAPSSRPPLAAALPLAGLLGAAQHVHPHVHLLRVLRPQPVHAGQVGAGRAVGEGRGVDPPPLSHTRRSGPQTYPRLFRAKKQSLLTTQTVSGIPVRPWVPVMVNVLAPASVVWVDWSGMQEDGFGSVALTVPVVG